MERYTEKLDGGGGVLTPPPGPARVKPQLSLLTSVKKFDHKQTDTSVTTSLSLHDSRWPSGVHGLGYFYNLQNYLVYFNFKCL